MTLRSITLDEVWSSCHDRMMTSATVMLGPSEAEDVVSEYILRVAKILQNKKFNGAEHAKAYTLFFFKRHMIDFIRKRETRNTHLTRYQLMVECMGDYSCSHASCKEIRECSSITINDLRKLRLVETAALLDGVPIQDLCAMCNMNRKALRKKISKQLELLREIERR